MEQHLSQCLLEVGAATTVSEHLHFVHHNDARTLDQMRMLNQQSAQLLVGHDRETEVAGADVVIELSPVACRDDNIKQVSVAATEVRIMLVRESSERNDEDPMPPSAIALRSSGHLAH